jgi:ABC-type lipoprotein release transport system permease subunit
MRLSTLILRNISRHRRQFILSTLGVVFGIGTLIFFVSLGHGARVNLLNNVFDVNELEVIPRSVNLGSFQRQGGLFGDKGTGLNDQTVDELSKLPSVTRVYPRTQLSFPSIARGGDSVVGENLYAELIGDGIPPELVSDEFGVEEGINAFVDWHASNECTTADQCPPDVPCNNGVCEAPSCTNAGLIWQTSTRSDAIRVSRAVRGQRSLRVRGVDIYEHSDDRFVLGMRGGDESAVKSYLEDSNLPGSLPPEPQACPNDAHWCNPSTGRCEMPVPVLVSYTMLELYNGNVQSMLSGTAGSSSLPRLNKSALIGIEFEATLGEGIIGNAKRVESGATETEDRRFRVVGFSNAAIPIGATIPLPYVERWNARFNADDTRGQYHSILVRTNDPKKLPEIAAYVEDELGLAIHSRFDDQRRASTMLTIITIVFAVLSLAITLLSAINLANTFLMIVAERRREFGIIRALGGKRAQVAILVLGEAILIAAVGCALAWAISVPIMFGADSLILNAVPNFPFKPDAIFAVPLWLVPTTIGVTFLFCGVGALIPAVRASSVDPAEALRD